MHIFYFFYFTCRRFLKLKYLVCLSSYNLYFLVIFEITIFQYLVTIVEINISGAELFPILIPWNWVSYVYFECFIHRVPLGKECSVTLKQVSS